jgi:hypothetical protein
MTTYSFFRKWVNDKMYRLKLKRPPCHPQTKEPLWVPQWTKPAEPDDPGYVYDPNHVYNPDWTHDIMYSELLGNLNYHYKRSND